MKGFLKMKKNTYFVILILVIVISFFQVQILVSELYAVIDGTIKASAQEEQNKLQLQQQVVGKPQISPARDIAPTEISIEKIGLNLKVVESPLINGTWNTYQGVANYAEGTSGINGKTGNIGIFAHDRTDGFTNIKLLKVGDSIVIKGENTKATYTVEKSSIANPSDVEVFYPTSEPKLTLITCEGAFSQQRYVIVAQLSNLEIL